MVILIRNVKIIIATVILALFGTTLCLAQADLAPDEENCLICHRYPGLGRVEKNGKRRVYYINDQMFASSVHGKLRCKSCHVDLTQIPHKEIKPVDCSTQCHLKEPSSNQDFSHKNMVRIFRNSVHGKGRNDKNLFPEDRPTCTYCHNNRAYNPYAGFWGNSEALSRETLARCQGCHVDKNWTRQIYAHFTDRMRRRRDQNEVIQLCTSCHEDEKKMARHGLEAVSTFKDTFHWILVKYGVKNAPDCITCHVPVGYTTHEIHPRTDPMSPVHSGNRVKTCSNQGGIQACHPGATQDFAEGRVHAYGTKVQLMASLDHQRTQKAVQEPLLLERAREEVSAKEVFQYKVLLWIKLLYQVLIAMVIGFMSLHQLLDYYRARKRINMQKRHDRKEVTHG